MVVQIVQEIGEQGVLTCGSERFVKGDVQLLESVNIDTRVPSGLCKGGMGGFDRFQFARPGVFCCIPGGQLVESPSNAEKFHYLPAVSFEPAAERSRVALRLGSAHETSPALLHVDQSDCLECTNGLPDANPTDPKHLAELALGWQAVARHVVTTAKGGFELFSHVIRPIDPLDRCEGSHRLGPNGSLPPSAAGGTGQLSDRYLKPTGIQVRGRVDP